MASDSQAMGRVGEVITRTWQTAHKMKRCSAARSPATRQRTTTNASSATWPSTRSVRRSRTGVSSLIGSVEVGKLADLTPVEAGVLRRAPRTGNQGRVHRLRRHGRRQRFHSHPGAGVGAGRCSAPTGRRGATTNVTFLSGAAAERAGSGSLARLQRRLVPVRDTRALRKTDLPRNDALPGDGGGPRLLQRARRRRAAGVRTAGRGNRSRSATFCSSCSERAGRSDYRATEAVSCYRGCAAAHGIPEELRGVVV